MQDEQRAEGEVNELGTAAWKTESATETKKPHRMASYKEQRRLEDLMLENSSAHPGEPSTRVWHPGFGFADIAKMVSSELNAKHAMRVATLLELTFLADEFGTVSAAMVVRLTERLEQLERAIEDLERRVEILEREHSPSGGSNAESSPL